MRKTFPVFWLLAAILCPQPAAADGATSTALPKCLFVSSYHRGYAWSDGEEAGLRAVLRGKCQLRQFDMDTKRKKSPVEAVEAAQEARAIIASWAPDVVITADDNAARYLIKPYYRDKAVPFVFCGVNWTVDEYGFPYSNVTGMIEVAPIAPLLRSVRAIVPMAREGFYIGADTLTEQKNLKRFREAAARVGFDLEYALVLTMQDWIDAFRKAQNYDFVVIGSEGGITGWSNVVAEQEVLATTRKLSVTNLGWMTPFAILGVTKVPEEQGEWAGKAALRIIDGLAPRDIPIVSNARRDLWLNTAILGVTSLHVSKKLLRRAKKIDIRQSQLQ